MIILISRKVFQNSFRNTFIPQWICLQGNNDFSRNHIINLKLPFEEAFAQTKFFFIEPRKKAYGGSSNNRDMCLRFFGSKGIHTALGFA